INGQPNLSDGNSPYLQSNDYGVWAAELFKKLEISKATVIGASFGGIVCMKLCIAAPHLVEKAILMNPAGFTAFSSSFQNLYYNFLPIIFKSRFAVKQFVNKIALHPPQHDLPLAYKNLLTDYILYTVRNFKNKAELPSPMEADDLKKIAAGIYLIHGENDLLFPPAKTISIAKKNMALLKGIHVLAHTAHGIETSKAAINIVAGIMNAKYASI
ncbi:MAG TPA: alpha/beta hydrolase, partial [Chitinophagaceae bacterium]|nr:alpha/beta hydrolase [Chitinophagaceae bacterium]